MADTPKAATSGASADVQVEFDALRRDIANLTEAVARLVGESADEAADYTRDRVHKTATSAKQAANVASTKVTDFVDEKPATSLLIAFGVGLLFGSVIRRS